MKNIYDIYEGVFDDDDVVIDKIKDSYNVAGYKIGDVIVRYEHKSSYTIAEFYEVVDFADPKVKDSIIVKKCCTNLGGFTGRGGMEKPVLGCYERKYGEHDYLIQFKPDGSVRRMQVAYANQWWPNKSSIRYFKWDGKPIMVTRTYNE